MDLHNVGQWALLLGLILSALKIWSMVATNIGDQVNLKRDIQDLQKDMISRESENSRIFVSLAEIKKNIHSMDNKLVRIETKMRIHHSEED